MDLIHDFSIGVLLLFLAFVTFDWGRLWWHARRHGYLRFDRAYPDPPWRWQGSYLGYKIWTYLILATAWVLALWQLILGLCWLVELAFAVAQR